MGRFYLGIVALHCSVSVYAMDTQKPSNYFEELSTSFYQSNDLKQDTPEHDTSSSLYLPLDAYELFTFMQQQHSDDVSDPGIARMWQRYKIHTIAKVSGGFILVLLAIGTYYLAS